MRGMDNGTNVRRRNFLCLLFVFAASTTSIHAFTTFDRPSCPSRTEMHLPATTLLTSEEIRQRLEENLTELRIKDRLCRQLEPEELQIEYEDDDLIVVVKPAGILCIPSEPGVNSMLATVAAHVAKQNNPPTLSMNQMIVHRLGCDTSGLMIFAKSSPAMRGMHQLFRTRKITRQYEALVAGHVVKDNGLMRQPLMRCCEYPPYMRVATDEWQRHLSTLDSTVVGKKLLKAPKASLTHYEVLDRFHFHNKTTLPVTRLRLTSMTGRTHQLNVHCAALGHPIVKDTIYGIHGKAAHHGGLETTEFKVDDAIQGALQEAASNMNMCIHACRIRFLHPCTGKEMEFTNAAPF